MSAIDDKHADLGGDGGLLGKPTTDEMACPDKVGRYRHFESGSIYWHPLTGAHEVHGLIRDKWAKLGWEKSFLGYPKSDESPSGGGAKGRFNLFQGGAITWKSGAKEAFETHGAIRSKFGQMGWEAGLLGFPTTDETKTPDEVGRYSHFNGGSVYWKPTVSAHEVHGLIRNLWADQGWEQNADLGYPISDELHTHPGSKHRFSDFENGVLYFKSGSSSAVALSKFVIGDASQSADEVFAPIKDLIVTTMKSDSRVYIKSGPTLKGVSDYRWDGAAVHNRMYRIHVSVGIDIPYTADPTSTLDFRIGTSFDRDQGRIWASLYDAEYHTHVPWPTSIGVSAAEINAKYKEAIDPLVGVPQGEQSVPEQMHLLSAKVMPNGDLNVYVQPLFDG